MLREYLYFIGSAVTKQPVSEGNGGSDAGDKEGDFIYLIFYLAHLFNRL